MIKLIKNTLIILSLSLIFSPTTYAETYTGNASWYGAELHGNLMSNGHPFNMYGLTVAHRTLPLGTKVLVINPANGKECYAEITDRGPWHKVWDYKRKIWYYDRDWDLSWKVKDTIKGRGVTWVRVDVISYPVNRGVSRKKLKRNGAK